MSVKDVKDYYNQICEQYNEMLENLRDLEKDVEENVVSLDFMENLKTTIAPLKDNYERWCYMMYLLNKPQRKSKEEKYANMNKSKMEKIPKKNSIESVIAQNEEILKNMKVEL